LNVASLTDNGAGDVTVTWSTPFSSANYAYTMAAEQIPSANPRGWHVTQGGKTAASLRVGFTDGAGNPSDFGSVSILAFGDQ
jgi:hypothetical protein